MTTRQTRELQDPNAQPSRARSSLPALAVRISDEAQKEDHGRLTRIGRMIETDGASAWYFALNGSWALDFLDLEERGWSLPELGVLSPRRQGVFPAPERTVVLNKGFADIWSPVATANGATPFSEIGRITRVSDERALGDFTHALRDHVSEKQRSYLAAALRAANRRLGIDNAMIVIGSVDADDKPTGLIVMSRDPNMRFAEDGTFVVELDYDLALTIADLAAVNVLEGQSSCIALQIYLDMKRLSQTVQAVGLAGEFRINILFPEGCVEDSRLDTLLASIGNAVWLHEQVSGADNEDFVFGSTHTIEYVLGS